MITLFARLIWLVLLVSVATTSFGKFEEPNDSVKGIILKEWSIAGAEKVKAPNPVSDVVGYKEWEAILGEIPTKCQVHLAKETEQLKTVEYDAHKWMEHVSQCLCCGPALAGLFDAHVNNVAHLPHMVAFFDFDSSKLTFDNQERIREFILHNRKLNNFMPNRHFLLIARASRTISVNHPLEYLRDHSIYNLLLSEKRAIAVRQYINTVLFDNALGANELYDTIPIRRFGMADPQINPSYAYKYNIEQSQWQRRYFKGEDPNGFYRLNQSVVVIAFDGDLHEDKHSFEQPIH